jgi:hypothetical protein
MKYKKKTIKYFAIILLFSSIMGCSKSWLDKKSDKQQSVPATSSDYQELLDNSAILNQLSLVLGEIASDGHYISEVTWVNSGSANSKNAYVWAHSQPYSYAGWQDAYEKILYANLALDGINKISPYLDQEKIDLNNIKGQALFLRSFVFFSLAQIFAPPYDASSAQTDLGIPLKLNSDVTEKSTRSTVGQTYQRIIEDLKVAQDLVPVTALYPTRGSKVSVYGLLSRVYLSMGMFDSAFVYADKCLNNYNALLDFNTLSTSNSQIGTFVSSPKNPEVIFQAAMDEYSFISSSCLIDSTLYNSYDSNDLRKSVFFNFTSNASITFKGNYNDNSTKMFTGLAIDEIYLTRAECFARKGNKDAAMVDLNTLLIKRWKNNVNWNPLTAITADDALNKILNERSKELILRGIRWMDLRRLNKESQFQITLRKSIGGDNYSLEPNSFKYTFPIPDDIIKQTNLQQNAGW